MSETHRSLLAIVLVVIASTTGQALLKAGLNRVGDRSSTGIVGFLWRAAAEPFVWVAIVCFCAAVAAWMFALSGTELSWGYPLLGLSYITVMLAGRIFFGDQITSGRVAGTALVLMGAFLIGRS